MVDFERLNGFGRREMDLSVRLGELLGQSIEQYIKTAAPIASGAISMHLHRDDLHRARSPATIRNDLKILEQLGFLHQVHASSGGRIPTAKAYAHYIETICPRGDPSFVTGLIDDLAQLSAIFAKIEGKLAGRWGGDGVHLFGGTHGQTRCTPKIVGDEMGRRVNFQKLFEEPELQMSALYLIIKEKIDNGKM